MNRSRVRRFRNADGTQKGSIKPCKKKKKKSKAKLCPAKMNVFTLEERI